MDQEKDTLYTVKSSVDVNGKRKWNGLEVRENPSKCGDRKRIRSHSRNCKREEELFSDKGLDFVSSNLGTEWIPFMTRLDMKLSRLDQHQMNHVQDVQQAIFHALKDWTKTIVHNDHYEKKKRKFFRGLKYVDRRDLVDEIVEEFKVEGITDSYLEEDEHDEAESRVADDNLDDSQEENVPRISVTGIVKKKSRKMLSYKNSNGDTKFYFNLVCNNCDEFYFLRNYCVCEFDDIFVGETYRFEDLVRHKDELWIVKIDSVAVIKPESYTFEGEIPCLPEEEPLEGVQRSLSEALTTARQSAIIAKILKVSEVSYVKNGKLPVQKLAVMDDESNIARLVLFNVMAEYQINTIVKATAVHASSFKGKEELRLSRHSQIDKLEDGYDELREKAVPDQHELVCDSDFFGENLEKYEIDSIYSVKEYECCSYCDEGQVKLKDVCPRCQRPGKGEKGCVVKIGLVNPDGTRDKIVIFKSNASILFGTIDFVSRRELKDFFAHHF